MTQQERPDLSEIPARLLPWLRQKMPEAQDLSISDVRAAQGGHSTETSLFETSWRQGDRQMSRGMVLRRPPQLPLFHDYDFRRQVGIMNRLRGTSIPVPEVYWLENDESVLGTPFTVVGKIEATTVPPGYPSYRTAGIFYDASPSQREKMWWGFIETLANIHQLDWESLGLSFLGRPGEGNEALSALLEYYEEYLNWVREEPKGALPTFEAALEWLKENRYTPNHIGLCWGDSRLANIMYDSDYNVAAVLDWEIAYIGDPEADLGWFLMLDWRQVEEAGTPRLEGSPSLEETLQRYQELTGRKIKNLFYNEVLAPFRLGLTLVKLYKNLTRLGIANFSGNMEENSFCARRLAVLLDLPVPGSG